MPAAIDAKADYRREGTRLARLDGLRGVAACGVALYHVQALYPGGLAGVYGGAAGWLYAWGWTMVDLFFVISGYIFAHVYVGVQPIERPRDRVDFAVARIARLYPLHILLLLAVAALEWDNPNNGVVAFVAHLFMLQGLVPHASQSFVGPSWSISVEMVCYALFALTAAFGRRRLGQVSLVLVALAIVQLAITGRPGGPWTGDFLVRGLLGFFLGQLLWLHRDALRRVPAALLVAVAGAGLLIDTGRFSSLLPLALLAWPAVVLLALRWRAIEAAPLLWLGERSYAIYLLHVPVIHLVARAYGPAGPGTLELLALNAAVAGIVLLLADLALRGIERPSRRLIREAWARRGSARDESALPLRAELD